jgi:hypothetical protein
MTKSKKYHDQYPWIKDIVFYPAQHDVFSAYPLLETVQMS